jgi:hypothetical protein
MRSEEIEAWYDLEREKLYSQLLKTVTFEEASQKPAKNPATSKERAILKYHADFKLLNDKFGRLMALALKKERTAVEARLPGKKMKKK